LNGRLLHVGFVVGLKFSVGRLGLLFTQLKLFVKSRFLIHLLPQEGDQNRQML